MFLASGICAKANSALEFTAWKAQLFWRAESHFSDAHE